MKGFLPKYISVYLQLQNNPIYQARSIAKNTVKQTASRTVNFNYTFSYAAFKNGITLAMTNSVFAIHDNNSIKLLIRLRLNVTLKITNLEKKILDTINLMRDGGFELESTTDLSLCCQNHIISRSKHLKNI